MLLVESLSLPATRVVSMLDIVFNWDSTAQKIMRHDEGLPIDHQQTQPHSSVLRQYPALPRRSCQAVRLETCFRSLSHGLTFTNYRATAALMYLWLRTSGHTACKRLDRPFVSNVRLIGTARSRVEIA